MAESAVDLPPPAGNSRLCRVHAVLWLSGRQESIDKILLQYEIFQHDRCLARFSVGTMPHGQIMRSIALMGTEVAPVVRAEIARRRPAE